MTSKYWYVLILLTTGCVGLSAQNIRLTPTTPRQTRVERALQLNDRLLQVHSDAQDATADALIALQMDAIALIHERAAILTEMIKTQPAEALKLIFSADLSATLTQMFPRGASEIETYGSWEGKLERWAFDDADMHSSGEVLFLRTGERTLQLCFIDAESQRFKTGDTVRVTGVHLGSVVLADPGTRLLAKPIGVTMADPEQSSTLKPQLYHTITTSTATTSVCSTTGVQNTAVLLATFPGVTPPAIVTQESVNDNFFGTSHSLDGYWRESSYGATSTSGDVLGWYQLNSAYTCSTLDQARDEAISIASAAGVNFQKYTRIFLIYPNLGCTAGFATIGCSLVSTPSGTINASTSFIQADYMTGDQGVYFAAHEGGHNLGLQHAGTLSFGTEALGSQTNPGTVNEFGDDFSSMGSQTLGQYSAQHKAEVLGWLANGANYQTVETNGTWTLQPFESSTAGLEALKIQRGTGSNDWLWLEFREPIGSYDSLVYFQQPAGGAFIHYEDPTVGAYTHLLNFSPQTGSWYAPALLAGQTWVDPYSNLSIAIQSVTPTAMTVGITYGAMPCTPGSPVVKLSPANPSTSAGNAVTYTLSVTNSDSTACTSRLFNLGSSQPAGWATLFAPTTLTLAPGQTGTAAMSKNVPASAPVGTFTVDSTATDNSQTGAGSASVTVTVPALTITVSTISSTFGPGQSVPLTAQVSSGGNAAASASVTFTVTQPNGSKSTKTTTADSTGKAVWNYKITPKGPTGSYSFAASATYNARNAASSSGTFQVQ